MSLARAVAMTALVFAMGRNADAGYGLADDMANEQVDPELGDTPFNPEDNNAVTNASDKRLVFYDVEVFKNLFIICWMYEDSDIVNVLVNPTPREVEALLQLRLVGFYNRRYDNHILYAAYMGYDVDALYKLSQKIINDKDGQAMFGEAYNLSHADIWDFASIKKSLKKWEIDLGIFHSELGMDWDQEVPDDMVEKVIEYCKNDVRATKAVFEDRKG